MTIRIVDYNACCNIGNNIREIYENAIEGNNSKFSLVSNIINNKAIRIAPISEDLPIISDADFNIRCNQLILKSLQQLSNSIEYLKTKYKNSEIGVIIATTNSGVAEYELSKNMKHAELGNPALFVKTLLNLKNVYLTVSTACSSGLKAFSLARNIINKEIAKAVIVIGVDSLAKVPLYGFYSLELLTDKPSNPFSKNHTGINIGEAVASFIIEKNNKGIEIAGIGESSDNYHATTPNPNATEVKSAINMALTEAHITANDIDYINLHGTGTYANDLMEAKAINDIFGEAIPASSTKPLTGHCLGAAASIETALCCFLIDNFDGHLYPHVYDNIYDPTIPKINLVKSNNNYNRCDICMCNSFGFGGSNAILILRKYRG